eukprot:1040345-Pyramimonas_sp.AAC.1
MPGEGTSVRLDAAISQARSLARRFPVGDSSDWRQQCQDFLESWEDDLQEAVKAIAKRQQD